MIPIQNAGINLSLDSARCTWNCCFGCYRPKEVLDSVDERQKQHSSTETLQSTENDLGSPYSVEETDTTTKTTHVVTRHFRRDKRN